MPVTIEFITAPSTQDLHDLQRIYQDAPPWLVADTSTGEQLIAQGISQGRLLAGRFNSRLLGAALLGPIDDKNWQLSHLCVRQITRGRGVARRMLEEAGRLAHEAGAEVHLSVPTNQPIVQALAVHLQSLLPQ